MKKVLFLTLILLTGCLGENRPVKIRRSAEDLASGASIHSGTEYIWWRTPVYRDTPRDENPWEDFIRQPESNWFDPWAADPATNYGADEFPKVRPVPLPTLPKVKEKEPEGVRIPIPSEPIREF